MKQKHFLIVSCIIVLLSFISSHFLTGIYHLDREVYQWILADIYLYAGILLQLIIILVMLENKSE